MPAWSVVTIRVTESTIVVPNGNFSTPAAGVQLALLSCSEMQKKEVEMLKKVLLPLIALDAERNGRYRGILEDRYIREIFQNYEIQPALYSELTGGDWFIPFSCPSIAGLA
jgi:hypothetical protein